MVLIFEAKCTFWRWVTRRLIHWWEILVFSQPTYHSSKAVKNMAKTLISVIGASLPRLISFLLPTSCPVYESSMGCWSLTRELTGFLFCVLWSSWGWGWGYGLSFLGGKGIGRHSWPWWPAPSLSLSLFYDTAHLPLLYNTAHFLAKVPHHISLVKSVISHSKHISNAFYATLQNA